MFHIKRHLKGGLTKINGSFAPSQTAMFLIASFWSTRNKTFSKLIQPKVLSKDSSNLTSTAATDNWPLPMSRVFRFSC